MLQGRLIGLAVTVGLVAAVAGCSDGSDGAIADNVIEPGITAINNAELLTCDQNLAALQTAIQSYAMLEGTPPADETALIDAEYLRGEVEGWDVVDGQTVATDARCGEVGAAPANTAVPATAPATTIGQIVTATEAPMTAEQMLQEMTPDEVAALGGVDCARELTVIVAAADRYVAEQVAEPADLAELISKGYLTAAPALWTLADDQLIGVEGSGCTTAGSGSTEIDCRSDARALEVAYQAYLAEHPNGPAPSQENLVAAGLLAAEFDSVLLVDGVVVPTLDGPCIGINLSP